MLIRILVASATSLMERGIFRRREGSLETENHMVIHGKTMIWYTWSGKPHASATTNECRELREIEVADGSLL